MHEPTSGTIRCPKCGHEQTNQSECAACGLLFTRYERSQDRKRQAQSAGDRSASKSSLTRLGAPLVLVAVTATLTYGLLGGHRPAPVTTAPPPVAQTPRESMPSLVEPAQPLPRKVERAPAIQAGNPIGQVQSGTVAIETPWGKGSGFFVTETIIVTNKHVIEPNRDQVQEVRRKVETGRQLISLERQKLADLRRRLSQMENGPARQQLVIILQEREKELAEILPKQEEAEARLQAMEKSMASSDIKIFLADGSEYAAHSSQVSASRDLALLWVYSAEAKPLRPAPQNSVLQQGDKVFTVGNPVGLRNTVTAGIFSGYRKNQETGELLLQTDAPINPGNSGGPLIDEHGRVHGVNTMIIRDTQGIGFAIPIHTVFEEFSLTPP